VEDDFEEIKYHHEKKNNENVDEDEEKPEKY